MQKSLSQWWYIAFYNVVLLWLFLPLLQAPMHYVDETEFLSIAHSENLVNPSLPKETQFDNFFDYHKYYLQFGRFKPFSVSANWAIAKLSGGEIFYIRLIVLFLALLFFNGLYFFLNIFNTTPLLRVVTVFMVLASSYGEIWWRPGPSEYWAAVFLLLAFYLKHTKGNRWGFYLSLIGFALAFCSKENILLASPAFLLLSILLQSWQTGKSITTLVKEEKKWIIHYVIITGALALIAAGCFYYNPLYRAESSMPFFEIASYNFSVIFKAWYLWVFFPLIFFFKEEKSLLLGLFFSLIILFVSQLVAYKDNIIPGACRYLFPLLLVPQIAFIYSLQQGLRSRRWIRNISYGLMCGALLFFVKNAKQEMDYFSSRCHLYANLLNEITAKSIDLIFCSPNYHGGEFAESTLKIFHKRGIIINSKQYWTFSSGANLSPNEHFLKSLNPSNTGTHNIGNEKEFGNLYQSLTSPALLLWTEEIHQNGGQLFETYFKTHSFREKSQYYTLYPLSGFGFMNWPIKRKIALVYLEKK